MVSRNPSTMEQAIKNNPAEQRYWWDDLPEPEKINIDPSEEERQAQLKQNHLSRGFFLIFGAIAIRIYCFCIGALMIAYGGWILYQIKQNLIPLSVIQSVAAGCFLVLAGILTVLVELRTRSTMERCLSTYIILSNHFARGVFYLIVAALTFPINVTIPYIGQFGNSRVLSGFMAFGGIINIIYAPFYYRYMQRKAQSKVVRGPGNPEEIAYELDMKPIAKKDPAVESEVHLASSQDFDEDEEGLEDEDDLDVEGEMPTNNGVAASGTFENVTLDESKSPLSGKKHDIAGRKVDKGKRPGPDLEAIRSSLGMSAPKLTNNV